MRILCDCPDILSQWRDLSGGTSRVVALSGGALAVWHDLVGEAPAWEFDSHAAGLPEGLGVIVERAEASQFDRLLESARSGTDLPGMVAALALSGENFHGQGMRPWKTECGNLHLTVFFSVDLPAEETLGVVSILPTLAVMDAYKIHAAPAERTGIRWLNDVFVKGRKLAGSIAATETEGDRVQGLLFGIGVNVEKVPVVPGDVFVPEASSLRSAFPEAGWSLGRATVRLLRSLETRMGMLRAGKAGLLLEEYAAGSACVGRRVRIWPKHTEDPAMTPSLGCGRVISIDTSLALRLEGISEPLSEGRLAFVEDCRAQGLQSTGVGAE